MAILSNIIAIFFLNRITIWQEATVNVFQDKMEQFKVKKYKYCNNK